MSGRHGFEVETVGDVTVVRFLGATVLDGPAVEALLAVVAAAPAPPRIAVDFGRATIIDSAALGKLLFLHSRLTAAGGRLMVHALNPELAEVFRITKLDHLFGFDPDDDEGGSAGVPARVRPTRPSGGRAVALPPPPPDDAR